MKRSCLIFVLLIAKGLVAAEAELPRLASIPPNRPFSFVVLGDNRGDESGEQPAAFVQVLQAVAEEAPAFVLDTGDMIYGHNDDEQKIREQWRVYQNTVNTLRVPIFHIPGNHDLWSEPSARLYRELWGPTYYAFDYANSRFIGLDTETANGQLSETELHWLEQQLRTCTQTNVFLFLHRPLFPVDGGIGSSLDQDTARRDQLHHLLTGYRQLIRGVFSGHEHLFDFQERDGVPYYITGGGGAPLYVAPELGGFHHFLSVRVTGNQAKVELRKICAPSSPVHTPSKILPGQVLESWKTGFFWCAWDRSANVELVDKQATDGRRALRLNFDLAQYAWPVLVLSLGSSLNLSDCETLRLDVYAPNRSGQSFSLTTAIQGVTKHEAPSVKLKPGWNTVETRLESSWLPADERKNVQSLEWSLAGANPRSRGNLVFDNLRITRPTSRLRNGPRELLESWERPLLWRVFDETVRAEIGVPDRSGQASGLVLHLDLAKCPRPILFARLNPPWDLRNVSVLSLHVDAGDELPPDLTLVLAFRAKDVEFASPPQRVSPGASELKFNLDPAWLPQTTRAAAEQIVFRLISTNSAGQSDLRLRTLRATAGY